MKTLVAIIGWGMAVIVSLLAFAVLRHETGWRDDEISNLKRENARMKQGLSKVEVGLSELKNSAETMTGLLPDEVQLKQIKTEMDASQGLKRLEQSAQKMLDLQKLTDQIASAKDRRNSLKEIREKSTEDDVKSALLKLEVKEAELILNLTRAINAMREPKADL